MQHWTALVVAFLGSVASACGPRAPAVRQPVGQTTVTAAPQEATTGYVPSSVDLYTERRAADPCAQPLPSITFAFDSAVVEPAEDLKLQRLARALAQPSFGVSTTVFLVGHADPTGPSTYNLNLALERAERVKQHLMARGLGADRVVVSAAGESRRVPDDWSEARRVDIVLHCVVDDER